MLQFWSITETTQKRQGFLMLMVRSGKYAWHLGRMERPLYPGVQGAVGSPTMASVSGIAACSVSQTFCTLTGRPQALSSGLSFLPGILAVPL